MDRRSFDDLLKKIKNKFKARHVEFLGITDDEIEIRVISEIFEKISMNERFKQLGKFCLTESNDNIRNICFIFEAWTPTEFTSLKNPKSPKDTGGSF